MVSLSPCVQNLTACYHPLAGRSFGCTYGTCQLIPCELFLGSSPLFFFDLPNMMCRRRYYCKYLGRLTGRDSGRLWVDS